MSFKLFTVDFRDGDYSQIPQLWNNFADWAGPSTPGWEDMTIREANKTLEQKLAEYNAWTTNDEMDDNGILPVVWSLWFKSEQDATAFVLRWS